MQTAGQEAARIGDLAHRRSLIAVFTKQTSGFREDESTVGSINTGLLGIGQELTHGRARQEARLGN